MELRESGEIVACRRDVRALVARWREQERIPCRALASDLGVAESTLRRWCGTVSPPERMPGRPRLPLDAEAAQVVTEAIADVAARTTVAQLKSNFPSVARSYLASELSRARRDLRAARRSHLAQLTWLRPGSVWAGDFTELDGRRGDSALAVRDLASSAVLYASIAGSQSASLVVDVLDQLFDEHGPPLVFKCDNGSGFVAHCTKRFLAEHGVLTLFSPPKTPAYNGACERGIGVIKAAAEDVARLAGHVGPPTQAHLDSAARLLNGSPRGRAASASTAARLWNGRAPLAPELRRDLDTRYRRHEHARRAELGIAAARSLNHAEQASLDRHAVREALCELDLLSIRRR
jgi:transposase